MLIPDIYRLCFAAAYKRKKTPNAKKVFSISCQIMKCSKWLRANELPNRSKKLASDVNALK